jgi:hypothetical protein
MKQGVYMFVSNVSPQTAQYNGALRLSVLT